MAIFKAITLLATVLAATLATNAGASETISYRYDAKGRLLRVTRGGSVNNAVIAYYTYDKADNRRTVKVTGSPNPPQP